MVGSGSWGYSRKTVGNTFSSETHVIECQVIGGWKGWKKITVYWKIWGNWLENHIQIAEFWLEFFLMVCGNPVDMIICELSSFLFFPFWPFIGRGI